MPPLFLKTKNLCSLIQSVSLILAAYCSFPPSHQHTCLLLQNRSLAPAKLAHALRLSHTLECLHSSIATPIRVLKHSVHWRHLLPWLRGESIKRNKSWMNIVPPWKLFFSFPLTCLSWQREPPEPMGASFHIQECCVSAKMSFQAWEPNDNAKIRK